MKKSAYGKPLLIGENGEVVMLEKRTPLNELAIQNLIFEHPDLIPFSDIDESYNPIVSICKELKTNAGPLDVLMVSPNGEICIVETKLWKNPQARREVIAQILDYAKEMALWSYEDLQREVNRKLKSKGNTLYEIIKKKYIDQTPSESDFVDSINRNLSKGKFLLLIVGDGIREGAQRIVEFFSNVGHLNFTFAMIELSLYDCSGLGTIVLPKTLVKTIDIPKILVEIPNGLTISYTDIHQTIDEKNVPSLSPEKEREGNFYRKFWIELINELEFDDPGQPLPNPAKAQNLFLYPSNTKKAWISAYFMKSGNRVGVYFRTQKDLEGELIADYLNEFTEDMKEELGSNVQWDISDVYDFGVRYNCDNLFLSANREEIKDFFKEWLNKFVNVLRPRLKEMNP